MLLLKKSFLRMCSGLPVILLSGILSFGVLSSHAQTLTVKGSDAVNPFYIQNGALLYIQGGLTIDGDGGGVNDYIQNNGTIQLVAGATPNQSNFTNNVTGLKTYTTGQTTGEVIFAANNETQTIGGGGTVEFMKLTVNNSLPPVLKLSEDVQVNGVLTIGGIINLQNSNLTLLSTATLAGAPFSTANMIQADGSGQFIRGIGVLGSSTSFTFPVGDATPNYTPAVLTFTSNTQAGTVGINVTNSTEANNNNPGAPYVYLSRYWTFSNTLNNYTYTGTFTYPTANLSTPAFESSLKLSQWTGSTWSQFAGSSASSNVLTEATSLTQGSAPLTGDFTGRTQCTNPTVYAVTGGTNCGSAIIGLSNSETGVNYQLVWNGTTNVGGLVAGTNNPLSFGSQSTAGTYTVVATSVYGGCTSNMSGSSIINPLPVAFNVTGGACVPAVTGLDGSQIGVNYQLVRDGNVNVGSIVAGTGDTLTFGIQNTAGIYSVVATNTTTNCSATMTGVTTVNICTSTWTGTTNSDWFTQTNWSPAAVPNLCAANVVIPATSHPPVIAGASVSVGNVNIASGVTLTLSGQNLSVCGNWKGGTAANAAVVGSGTVILTGTASQHIDSNTVFEILQLNNTQGAVLGSGAKVTINIGLHLQAGNLDATAGTLRLASPNANTNSYIDDFTLSPLYTGTVSGNITADRYVPVQGYNQHFLSSPVNSPLLSQINASGPDGAYVIPSPDCNERQSAYGSPYGSVFVYNDGHMPNGACMLGNWMVKSVGNMENGKGYSAYLTGNATLSLTGEANTGAIDISGLNNSGYDSVKTLQGQWIESGWNLVGNPYPSAINMTQSRSANGFQNQVQLWITSGPYSGTWQADVIDGDPDHLVIAPFQAFMVRATRASVGIHTYSFHQNERVRTTNVPFYRTNSVNTLKLEVNYNGIKDMTKISFNPSGTSDFDDEYDANKYNGAVGRPTLFTTYNDPEWYAINTLPLLKEVTTVPVGLKPEVNGTMSIAPQDIESFDPTTYIYLEDKVTGEWHNLRDGDYTFTTKSTDDADRFVLHFTPPANIFTADANCDNSGQINIEQPGSANWNYNIVDQNNTIISKGALNAGSPISISALAGLYTLTLSDNQAYTVVKTIQVSGSQPVIATFNTSASTVQAQDNIAFTSTIGNAATYSWDFGDGSTASGSMANHSYQTEGIYQVTLTATNAEGCSSTASKSITITGKAITGVGNTTDNKLNIWSSDNRVYIDFSKQGKVEAEIELYDVLGQLLSSEKFGRSTIYTHEIPNTEAAYVIVKVKNLDTIKTKRVFITNIR